LKKVKKTMFFTQKESGCSAENIFSRTAGYRISCVAKGSR